jgi:hypothetical protein
MSAELRQVANDFAYRVKKYSGYDINGYRFRTTNYGKSRPNRKTTCSGVFPGLVEYAGVTGPAYTFDHYVVAPDAVDRDGREFNNNTERVKQELWVSLSIM